MFRMSESEDLDKARQEKEHEEDVIRDEVDSMEEELGADDEADDDDDDDDDEEAEEGLDDVGD